MAISLGILTQHFQTKPYTGYALRFHDFHGESRRYLVEKTRKLRMLGRHTGHAAPSDLTLLLPSSPRGLVSGSTTITEWNISQAPALSLEVKPESQKNWQAFLLKTHFVLWLTPTLGNLWILRDVRKELFKATRRWRFAQFVGHALRFRKHGCLSFESCLMLTKGIHHCLMTLGLGKVIGCATPDVSPIGICTQGQKSVTQMWGSFCFPHELDRSPTMILSSRWVRQALVPRLYRCHWSIVGG